MLRVASFLELVYSLVHLKRSCFIFGRCNLPVELILICRAGFILPLRCFFLCYCTEYRGSASLYQLSCYSFRKLLPRYLQPIMLHWCCLGFLFDQQIKSWILLQRLLYLKLLRIKFGLPIKGTTDESADDNAT